MKIQIINGDCLEIMKTMEDNSVDSILTDPPAGISFMGKEWDKDRGGRDEWIKWMQEIASECLRVIKPGGHCLVWALPRTAHWTTTAWENAGFEVRDVLAHLFGSGFPKSLNIGKKIDKIQGNERIRTGEIKHHAQKGVAVAEERGAVGGGAFGQAKDEEITIGNSPFEGYGSALKPAREDWILLRKPLSEKTIAENCLKWGTGGIRIDDCRVGTEEIVNKPACSAGEVMKTGLKQNSNPTVSQGRFPSHITHDGSEEVLEVFPESGKGNGEPYNYSGKEYNNKKTSMFNGDKPQAPSNYNENGSASRFFYCSKPSKAERNMGCDNLEEKESKKMDGGTFESASTIATERTAKNNHPTVKPLKLMQYYTRLITPKRGICLDPFMGSGTTGMACVKEDFNFIGIEMDKEYCKIAEARIGWVRNERANQLF